jgi:hypothetical protein
MALKLRYYGQNDGQAAPDVALTGNPGTDQVTLTQAGYIGGRIMARKTSATAGRGAVVVPCDVATMSPVGFLLNGSGEFAGSIGPSGSGKTPIVRAMPQFEVSAESFVAAPTTPYTVGAKLYCAEGANAGLFTADKSATVGADTTVVGICTKVPTATDPWLGVDARI